VPGGARIFHLLAADAWAATAPGGRAEGPVAVDQFERHGFVHLCFREQLVEIASWWFDAGDELVALEVDPSALTAELRLEASPSRWYPHLYGPIAGAAVVGCHPVPRTMAGRADLPRALHQPPPGFQVVAGDRAVQWRAGALTGDQAWIASAEAAVAEGRPVELIGGVVAPATLATAYESFALLESLVDGITRYDGDGFF
jgi:uncharacterized protein (DUF952 family)